MNELEKLEKTLCVLMRQANEIKKENAELKEMIKENTKMIDYWKKEHEKSEKLLINMC